MTEDIGVEVGQIWIDGMGQLQYICEIKGDEKYPIINTKGYSWAADGIFDKAADDGSVFNLVRLITRETDPEYFL